MSLNQRILSNAKRASKKESLIVSGYIRLNAGDTISFGIIQICLAFYAFLDRWDFENKSDKIKIYGKGHQIVTSLLDNDDKAQNYQTILGVRRVSRGIHHWKLKIVKHYEGKGAGYWRLTVGVIRINDAELMEKQDCIYDCKWGSFEWMYRKQISCSVVVNNSGHGTNPADTGNHKGCGAGCKAVGDVMDIFLDLESDKKCFAFGSKDKYHGIIEDDIDSGEYCLHVTFGIKDIALEIIDFQEIDHLP